MILGIKIASAIYGIKKLLEAYKLYLECKKLRRELKNSEYKPKH